MDEVTKVKYYAVVNDTIGGWDVSEYDKPISQHTRKERSIAWGLTESDARRVAELLTEHGRVTEC